MTTLDPLPEALVHLFLRVDAAQPTDPVLRAAWSFWQKQREALVMPAPDAMDGLPAFIRPHAFRAHLATNGSDHWIVSEAGTSAQLLLGLPDKTAAEAPDKRIAVRLRRLFDLVAEKEEPFSVMFELEDKSGHRLLVEILAAPLARAEKREHLIFAVINSRREERR